MKGCTVLRIFAALGVVLSLQMAAQSACVAPRYRQALTLADSKSELITNISISPRAFAPTSIICLATALKQRYGVRPRMIISIFASAEAASNSPGILSPETNPEDTAMLAQMHARYVYDQQRHEEYVEMIPALDLSSARGGLYTTRIDLPVSGTPHCRLEVHDRCVIALKRPDYPDDAEVGASGLVTLAATIRPDGRITGVRVDQVQASPRDAAGALSRNAVENLSSWQLEPAHRREAIRISYSYAIDNRLSYLKPAEVSWNLPAGLTILKGPKAPEQNQPNHQ
ncbi:MAG TPA: energy transducer TonB [Bryobacteraceae bacterium]|nr:energy transducer TonB [Bryobacteraceae bacterium]